MVSDLSIELCQEVKVLLEVCGQYSLNDKEAKTLKLHVIQVGQKVELWPGQIEVPGGCSVVVLQHRPVIVQHGLRSRRGEGRFTKENSVISPKIYYMRLYDARVTQFPNGF